MADRVVKVRLSAQIDDYKRGMLEAANATRSVGTEEQRLAQTRQSMQTLGAAGLAMGAALAAGIGVAVGKFAEFDQAMSFVAATGADARENMDALRQAALDAGAATVFSATEAANAIEEMAKAGLSAKDILNGGLTGALDLAAAGGLDVADAAGIAATALKVFNLEGSDMSHVADLLAAGAGKAMGDVTDLSAALAQGGQVAAATGLSIEETTATLAAFASQGLLGSDAGTSFKTMLQRLTPQSAEAAAKFKELQISAYDANGEFVGMTNFAGQLRDRMKDLTPEARNAALAVMFGSDAVRAANVIYNEGEEGIRDWITAVDDQGYAAETAATRLDNLIGDWEAFTGALDTAFISMGEGADGPLRALVQGLTDLVDGFNSLPDWAKQAALGVGLVTAGLGLVGGAALIAIPKLIAIKVAMSDMQITGANLRSGLGRISSFLGGPWGIAILAATTAITLFNKQVEEGIPSQAEIVNSIKTTTDSVESLKTAFERGTLETFLSGDYAEDLKKLPELLDHAIDAQGSWADALSTTVGQKGAYDSLKRYGEGLAELAQTDLPAAQLAFRGIRDEYKLTAAQTEQLLNEMGPYRDQLLKTADAQGISKDSAEFMALALGELPGSTAEAETAMAEMEEASDLAAKALDDVVQALDDVARGAMDLGEAKDSALSAINGMTDAAAAEGAALDGSNDASIRLRDSVREVEDAHRASAEAILQNGGTLDEANASWAAGRQAVIDMLVAKGMDTEAAAVWADANLGSAQEVQTALGDVKYAVDNIPTNPQININANTGEAQSKLGSLWTSINNLVNKTWNIPIKATVDGAGTVLKPPGQAMGGPVIGRGAKGVDSELRMLAPGEHVITAQEVDAAGGHAGIEAYRASLRSGPWVPSDRMGFSQQSQSQGPVQVSLAGAQMTLMVDGSPVRAVVQEQIVAYDSSRSQTRRRGVRTP